jgi:hypothetical protein
MFENSVRTSQETHHVFATETNRLMLVVRILTTSLQGLSKPRAFHLRIGLRSNVFWIVSISILC